MLTFNELKIYQKYINNKKLKRILTIVMKWKEISILIEIRHRAY